jgi:hypothetical protein
MPQYSGLRERTYPRAVDRELITVATERLDDHLPEGCAPAFIKIDVEGAECLVIEGALRTLAAHRPTVVVEHGPGGSDHYGSTPAQLHRLLCDGAGLRIFDLDGEGPYSLDRLGFRARSLPAAWGLHLVGLRRSLVSGDGVVTGAHRHESPEVGPDPTSTPRSRCTAPPCDRPADQYQIVRHR